MNDWDFVLAAHTPSVVDISGNLGTEGPPGYWGWKVTCDCRWSLRTIQRNAADRAANDHIGHRMGWHAANPAHGCEECRA